MRQAKKGQGLWFLVPEEGLPPPATGRWEYLPRDYDGPRICALPGADGHHRTVAWAR